MSGIAAKKQMQMKIHWLQKYSTPHVSTWWKHLLQQWLLWVFLGRSLPDLQWDGEIFICSSRENFSRSAKFLEIVDGLKSSSLAINVQLSSSQDFDWATEEHLFSSYSATPVWLWLCAADHCLLHSFRFISDWSRFSSRILLYVAPFIVPSSLTCLPVPADEKQPHNMLLPFTMLNWVMCSSACARRNTFNWDQNVQFLARLTTKHSSTCLQHHQMLFLKLHTSF